MPIHSVRAYTNTDNTPRTENPTGKVHLPKHRRGRNRPNDTSKTLGGRAGLAERSSTAPRRQQQNLKKEQKGTERIPLRTTCHHNHIGRESKQQCHPKESTPGEPSEETARRRRVRARSLASGSASGSASASASGTLIDRAAGAAKSITVYCNAT